MFIETFSAPLVPPWVQQDGSWGSSGGTGHRTSNASGSWVLATVPSAADGTVSLKLTTLDSATSGLVLRFTDPDNCLILVTNGSDVTLYKRIAGVQSTVRTETVTVHNGDTLAAVMSGNRWDLLLNGVSVLSSALTEGFNATVGNHGLACQNGFGGSVDDFSCPDAPAAGGVGGGMFF